MKQITAKTPRERIAILIIRSGLTRTMIAKRAKVSRTTFHYIERGVPPSPLHKISIARVFHVRPTDIWEKT